MPTSFTCSCPKTDTIIPWTALCLGLWIPNIYYWGLNQYITQRTLGSASLAEGQKGIVFAAALKLLIPFIIVFPGIIAFSLFDKDMADSAVADYVVAHGAGVKKDLGFTVLAPSKRGRRKCGQDADRDGLQRGGDRQGRRCAEEHDRRVQERYRRTGLLIAKLCMGKERGSSGSSSRHCPGAIVSSLAAVLNAASRSLRSTSTAVHSTAGFAKAGSLRSVASAWVSSWSSVAWWRRCWTIRSSGSIFTCSRQEFQGYVSPGVLAVFIFGLLNRTASGATGVTGLLLNPVLYYLFKRYLPQLDFLNRIALCMIIVLAVMTVMGFVTRLRSRWCSNPTRRSIWKVRRAPSGAASQW